MSAGDGSAYGTWASPVSAESVAAGEIRLGDVRVCGRQVFWTESRPLQGGRVTVVALDGLRDLTPEGFNVRTRVHEYGGAPYGLVDAGQVASSLVFSNFADQRLYLHHADGEPAALTPPGYRYADGVATSDGSGFICVREDHTDPAQVKNGVVRVALGSGELKGGEGGRLLFQASDFVAYPRVSIDGRRLAFIAWNHPDMPWTATTLYVAELGPKGLEGLRVVAGGAGESVLEPQWSADGTLYFLSDRSGFWNLYAWEGDAVSAVLPYEAEFAGPLWALGQANYALVGPRRILARLSVDGVDRLGLVDGRRPRVELLDMPFVGFESVQALHPGRAVMIARSAGQTAAVIAVEAETGRFDTLRRPAPADLGRAFQSSAEPIWFRGRGGSEVHGLFYPPVNPTRAPDAVGRPPLLVQVHGGPTAQATAAFRLDIQFWTSRGFAVLDVNYGGSSGFGRAYRNRLEGAWGVLDVQDVTDAARAMIAEGRVDPHGMAIRGSSAGGLTVLAALAASDVFSAGADYYGVCDLEVLARDTHKFESRYLDRLIGPYPAAKALYEARSPLNQLDGFRTPLIVFQGADDPIVPPNQAQLVVQALRARGAPVAYLEFSGEAHGFRKPQTVVRALEAELYFYGRVFGFEPAGDLAAVQIDNLP